ncbi:MAG: GAF domain-containing protein, partial [Candidatus Omnitrophica bacterium]|nr:GAF domain-containing protein [Candidatus Omnitrophota bacterium]
GCNQNDNLSKIVKTAGIFLRGNFAFYCEEDGLFLCMKGFWNIPREFKKKAGKVHCINYKVIAESKDEPLVINNFDTIFCAKVDTNISKYKIKTYVGCAVKIDSKTIGALCIFCDKNKTLTKNEVKILLFLAKTIALERQRKNIEETKSETKKKYQMLMDNIRDATFMTDTKFSVFLDASKKVEESSRIAKS